MLCEHTVSESFFELHVAACRGYILKVENGPNPFPGILEALAELTKQVVRKGPDCLTPKPWPRVLGSPVFRTCLYEQLAAVLRAPKTGC